MHCIIESIDSTATIFQYDQCICDIPEFSDTAQNDYALKEGSIGIDARSNGLKEEIL